MNLNFLKSFTFGLTVLVAAVILLFTLNLAYKNGKLLAQSELVVSNATQLVKGLEYFYNDQNRYPTAVEFSNPNSMGDYFTAFPAPGIFSAECPQNFVYKRPGAGKYELSFCLPKAVAGFGGGWNQATAAK